MKNSVPSATPWTLSLLQKLRPDLGSQQQLLGGTDGERWFINWLLNNGALEYAGLRHNCELIAYMAAPGELPGLSRIQSAIYLQRPDVQVAYPLPAGLEGYQTWFNLHGINEHKLAAWTTSETQQRRGDTSRPFGVNLFGYAFGQLGIGEDLRMAARALMAANIPFTIIDFPPGLGTSVDDRSMEAFVDTEAPYAINIFCLTALEHARFVLTHGSDLTEGRYNIAYWPWELSLWPEPWRDLFELVDEVWASSHHTYNSMAPECTVPIRHMPMVVELGPISNKSRTDFGLPKDDHLFCFSFDLNSSIHRKNPKACVDAFQRAFPLAARDAKKVAGVGLVIKAFKPATPNLVWDQLKKIVRADSRIRIFEETFPREDLLALYRSCNTFVSLHRAEGFGRGIAEALLLNLNVITTGYSGNVDFCKAPQSLLVRNKLIKVRAGEYPYSEHQVWADADVAHAAQRMVEAYQRPQPRSCPTSAQFSARRVGERYRIRLQEIIMQISDQPSPGKKFGNSF